MKVTAAGYPLRPEIIESAYYLRHYTHDARYVAMGETFFDDLVKYARVDNGYTTLKSVVTKEKGDWMPSFFLAETLKYLYLLFSDNNMLDNAVFNTEAHPLSPSPSREGGAKRRVRGRARTSSRSPRSH
jgi:Glycosyl hydrolase family 47